MEKIYVNAREFFDFTSWYSAIYPKKCLILLAVYQMLYPAVYPVFHAQIITRCFALF